MINILTILLLAVGVVNAVIGIGVFKRSTDSTLRWVFLLMSLALSLWGWGIVFFIVASSLQYAQLYLDIYYVAALSIGSLLSIFALRSAEISSRSKELLRVIPPLLLAAVLMIQPDWLIRVVSVTGELSQRVVIDQVPYALYGAVFIVLFGEGVVNLYRLQRHASGRRRSRQEIVTAGVAVAGLFGMIYNLILPWFGNYNYIMVGPLFSLFFTFSITYAIVKYSLFDLRRTFALSLAYILAAMTAAVVYAGAVWGLGLFVAGSTHGSDILNALYITLILVAAMLINPLKDFFDNFTSRLFLHDRYNPGSVLENFGDVVLSDVNADSIVAKAGQLIDETLRPAFVAVVLVDESGETTRVMIDNHPNKHRFGDLAQVMDEVTSRQQVVSLESSRQRTRDHHRLVTAGVALLARLELKNQLVGYLVLGEKRSGDMYGTPEQQMVSAMADELSLAVINAQRFDEIQAFNARLKREVTKATRELRSSNQKLLELDATKDEFVSMASHQLRTPLTSIKGYLSMVLEGDAGKLSDAQKQLLQEAYTSSERMVHLIGDFLNVSRLQTGKFVIDRHSVDLAKIIEQEVEGMHQIASSHGMTIRYKKPARVPTLYLDEGKIRQVVMNFIDNAIYYSPESSNIDVKLAVRDGNVVLEVIDKGMGVPGDMQDHLFTKFYRAENARKQRPDGTGIGLYLAKKVIDGHGGTVVFSSKLGKGSTFGFSLPIKELSKPAAPTEEETK